MAFGSFLRRILRPFGFPEESNRPTNAVTDCPIVKGIEPNDGPCSLCRRGCSRFRG